MDQRWNVVGPECGSQCLASRFDSYSLHLDSEKQLARKAGERKPRKGCYRNQADSTLSDLLPIAHYRKASTMEAEFIRQGVGNIKQARYFDRSQERAEWEKAQAHINACCMVPTEELIGIAHFDLWHMLVPCPIN